jgi:flagellin
LKIQVENFSASEARVRNVDVAKESANMIKQQILQQASINLLGQSNSQASMALKLIGG